MTDLTVDRFLEQISQTDERRPDIVYQPGEGWRRLAQNARGPRGAIRWRIPATERGIRGLVDEGDVIKTMHLFGDVFAQIFLEGLPGYTSPDAIRK